MSSLQSHDSGLGGIVVGRHGPRRLGHGSLSAARIVRVVEHALLHNGRICHLNRHRMQSLCILIKIEAMNLGVAVTLTCTLLHLILDAYLTISDRLHHRTAHTIGTVSTVLTG